jgi:hypothetical protein
MAETRKYSAVTIVARGPCCRAVADMEGKRLLSSRTPLLPVPDCTMPGECRCRYQKYLDRREDDDGRRFRFGNEGAAWYAGKQRRISRGRRAAD